VAERHYPSVYRQQYTTPNGEKRLTKTYFINYSVRGKRVRESTGLTSAKAAYDVLLQRKQEARTGRLIRPNAAKVTVATLEQLVVDDYSTRGFRTPAKVIRRRCRPLREYFQEAKAVDITAADLTGYVAHRRTVMSARGRPVTLGTISLELAHLQRGYTIAVKSRLLPESPEFPRLKLANERRVFVDRPLLEGLLLHLPADRRPIFEVGLLTGWRKEAILSRKRHHVDLPNGWLVLDGSWSKNGEPVRVPLTKPLRAIFQDQEDKAKALELSTGKIIPWCFFYYEGPKAGLRVVDFDAAFAKAREAAGIPHVHFHDLRRGAIRTLRRAGLSEHEVMAWVGLRTRAVFDRYDIIDEERLREVGEKAEAYYEGQAGKVQTVVPFGKG
jgi:integrase